MSTSLTLDTASSDGQLVLTVKGEIDLSNVESFTEALRAAVAEAGRSGGGTLVVDLRDVEYLDSAGVNVLFRHAEHIRVIAHPFLVRLLDISGFSSLASVEAAPPPVA
jgi:anti-anti-sigma factor